MIYLLVSTNYYSINMQRKYKETSSEPPNISTINLLKTKKFQADSPNPKQFNSSIHRWKYGLGKTPDTILISTWNINGIRGVMNVARKNGLINYLKDRNPDILCMNETKIDQQAYNKAPITLKGYNSYWNFCKCSAGYSGVAILSKYQPISMTQDLPQKQYSQEGRVITLEYEKFYLVAVYIPTSGQELERLKYRITKYDPAFQKHCEDLKKYGKPVIVCGDLNVAHTDLDVYRAKCEPSKRRSYEHLPGVTKQQRLSFTNFLDKGWVDTYRNFNPNTAKYTWWNSKINGRPRNIGWRLDYILIDSPSIKYVNKVQIINEAEGSDHCPVEAVLNLKDVVVIEKNLEKDKEVQNDKEKETTIEKSPNNKQDEEIKPKNQQAQNKQQQQQQKPSEKQLLENEKIQKLAQECKKKENDSSNNQQELNGKQKKQNDCSNNQ